MEKKLLFLIVTILLTGCGNTDKTDENTNVIQVAMPESRNANEFYLTEKGDGYFLLETGDGNFAQRWDYRFEDGNFYYDYVTTNNTSEVRFVEWDESPYMTLSVNNTAEELPAEIRLYRGVAELKGGESAKRRNEGVLSLDRCKALAESPQEGSPNVWNSKGDNEVWLTIGGSFNVYESESSEEAAVTYTYPKLTGGNDYRVCFTFSKKGALKS